MRKGGKSYNVGEFLLNVVINIITIRYTSRNQNIIERINGKRVKLEESRKGTIKPTFKNWKHNYFSILSDMIFWKNLDEIENETRLSCEIVISLFDNSIIFFVWFKQPKIFNNILFFVT